jgi:hypothetical protein
MEDLVSNGRIVKFRVESGRYLPSQQKVSKSRISSSNGGGFTHRGSGSVQAAGTKSPFDFPGTRSPSTSTRKPACCRRATRRGTRMSRSAS